MTHICVSHYLNQCWIIDNWTPRNELRWNLNRNSYVFIQENPFENVVWKMASILSRPQCVNIATATVIHSWPLFTIISNPTSYFILEMQWIIHTPMSIVVLLIPATKIVFSYPLKLKNGWMWLYLQFGLDVIAYPCHNSSLVFQIS